MIMRKTAVQISLILLILVQLSCIRPPEYPDIPQISFERLKLTDTASLVLTFHVRDGDGDIGLASESENIDDSLDPFHPFGVVVGEGDEIVTFNNSINGPYGLIPGIQLPITYTLFKGRNENNEAIIETRTVLGLFRAGDRTFYSNDDERPVDYDCLDYEIMSFYTVDQEIVNDEVVSETLVEDVDTVYVQRNPNHFNIYIELYIKQGGNYVLYELDECDPGYTARFPLFKKSNIGRPLDGNISYAFFSVLFNDPESSPLLTETLRIRFWIYDRTLQKSNEVITPDFRLLDLRQGDLAGN
jgi:hypothetical protein